MAREVRLEWSADALADLDRFTAFLHEHNPGLAVRVAADIVRQASILERHPEMGRPMAGGDMYRELPLRVMGTIYLFQYRHDGRRLVMLRVFHGRERR